jgi:hypothetical protein
MGMLKSSSSGTCTKDNSNSSLEARKQLLLGGSLKRGVVGSSKRNLFAGSARNLLGGSKRHVLKASSDDTLAFLLEKELSNMDF